MSSRSKTLYGLGLAVLFASPETGRTEPGYPVRFQWKAFDAVYTGVFYQTVTAHTKQVMTVMGMQVEQVQNQTFYIQWTPQRKDEDGNWVVVQKIIGLEIDIEIGGNRFRYDSTGPPDLTNPLLPFFKAFSDTNLTLTFDKDLKVLRIHGNKGLLEKVRETSAPMASLFETILSEDALKNRTEPTLFAFPPSSAHRWKQETMLDLGPIGSYKTEYFFTRAGRTTEGRERINLKAKMLYTKPRKSDKLPFTIESGTLTGEGEGYALFNLQRGWFDFYAMSMRLRGNLSLNIGGMKALVDLVQNQTETVTTTAYNPLTGPPETDAQPDYEAQECCGRCRYHRRIHLLPRVFRRCR